MPQRLQLLHHSSITEAGAQFGVDGIQVVEDRLRSGSRLERLDVFRTVPNDRRRKIWHDLCRDRAVHGDPSSAGLGDLGNIDAQAGDVGHQLHQERIAFGQPAGQDEPVNLRVAASEGLEHRACAVAEALEDGTVDVCRCGRQGHADHQAGEFGIHERRAATVPPVERDQSGLSGREFRGLQVVMREALAIGLTGWERTHEPI